MQQRRAEARRGRPGPGLCWELQEGIRSHLGLSPSQVIELECCISGSVGHQMCPPQFKHFKLVTIRRHV